MRTTGPLLLCLGFLALAGLGACRHPGEVAHPPQSHQGAPLPVGLNEASGLAFSQRQEGLLWLINDSGDLPRLYALDTQGRLRGSLLVEGETAVDWEDCASFSLDGKAWLMVADIGDNDANRRDLRLLFLPEPEPADLNRDHPLQVKPAWVLHVQYPGGPRDCESATVDAQNRRVLLISKRTKPPVLYSVPLEPAQAQPVMAHPLVSLDWIKKPSLFRRAFAAPRYRYSEQPTGFSLSSDGRHAAILSYTCVWYFTRKDNETWETCLASPGLRIPVGVLRQAEAVALSQDGHSLIVTGEDAASPLLFWNLKPQD